MRKGETGEGEEVGSKISRRRRERMKGKRKG